MPSALLQAAAAINAPTSITTEVLKAVGYGLAVLIAAPLTMACIRAAMFFGRFEKTVEQLGESMAAFTTWATEHGNRLTAVETKVEGIERRGDVPDRRHA